MIISVITTLFGLSIGLITLLADTRADKRLTKWGITVVVLSIAVWVLSVLKLWQDSEREQNAPFALADSDVTVELIASIGSNASPEELESHTPKSIKLSIFVRGEGGWECVLEPLGGFVNTGGYSRGGRPFAREFTSRKQRTGAPTINSNTFGIWLEKLYLCLTPIDHSLPYPIAIS